MKFYCPGVIATSKEEYIEKEGYVKIPTFSTPEFPTLQVIFSTNSSHKILHVEETSCIADVPKKIFKRTRELNHNSGNIRSFSTWYEVAEDLRHFIRRLAALAVPNTGNVAVISNSTAIVRLIAIYQSWPFEVIESLPKIQKTNKESQNDKRNIITYPQDYINEVTQYLEYLYRTLIPGHTREIYHRGSIIEAECRTRAKTEFVWEKPNMLPKYITQRTIKSRE